MQYITDGPRFVEEEIGGFKARIFQHHIEALKGIPLSGDRSPVIKPVSESVLEMAQNDDVNILVNIREWVHSLRIQ